MRQYIWYCLEQDCLVLQCIMEEGVTKQMLYNDWNLRTDKFGIIHEI